MINFLHVDSFFKDLFPFFTESLSFKENSPKIAFCQTGRKLLLAFSVLYSFDDI